MPMASRIFELKSLGPDLPLPAQGMGAYLAIRETLVGDITGIEPLDGGADLGHFAGDEGQMGNPEAGGITGCIGNRVEVGVLDLGRTGFEVGTEGFELLEGLGEQQSARGVGIGGHEVLGKKKAGAWPEWGKPGPRLEVSMVHAERTREALVSVAFVFSRPHPSIQE